jgi:hypothetical protein
MLRTGILLAAALIVAMPSVAQSNAPSGEVASSLTIPNGQGIVAKLQTDLDASKTKPGDAVEAVFGNSVRERRRKD